MSIELTFRFASVDNAKAFMSGLGKKSKDALESEPVASAALAVPVDLSGGPAEVALAAQLGTNATETVGGSDISAMLGLGGAPVPPAPAAPAAPAAVAPAPVAPAASPPVATPPVVPEAPPAQVDQKAIIAAFTTLGQTKGRNAIAGLLQELGVSTVIEIPTDHYVAVLNRVNELLNS